MKKGLAILLAIASLTALTACGKKAEAPSSSDASKATAQATAAATDTAAAGAETAEKGDDSSSKDEAADAKPEVTVDPNLEKDKNGEVYGMTEEHAIEQADMDEIEGTELKSGDTEENAGKGSIANLDIEIQDAKVIDYDDSKVVIISYEFKNNNSSPKAFSGLIATDVLQGETTLRGAAVTGVKGVNTLSSAQAVESGQSAVVQEAYTLSDDTTEITVNAYEYGAEALDNIISRHFSL